MREIKFRGKRKDNGEWVYGYLFILQERYCIVSKEGRFRDNEYGHFNLDGVFEVLPETVGQFTELKDKNGKEIYEGDIISWLGKEVEDGKQIFPKRIWEVEYDFDRLSRIRNVISQTGTAEVIGNVYESPELLEEKEK